jgi:hypothetical protein
MKSRIVTCIAAVALFATLAFPVGIAAQDNSNQLLTARMVWYQV